MEFSVKSGAIIKLASPCTVVGVFESRRLSPSARQLDLQSGGYLTALLKKGDLPGQAGQTLIIHDVPGCPCERILLIGCGKEGDSNKTQYNRILQAMGEALLAIHVKDALCTLTELKIKGMNLHDKIRLTVQSLRDLCCQRAQRY